MTKNGVIELNFADVILDMKAQKEEFRRILETRNIALGIWKIEVGESDFQTPHERDEVYIILSGKAKLKIEEKIFEVSPNKIFFVKRDTEHNFFDIVEDVELIYAFH